MGALPKVIGGIYVWGLGFRSIGGVDVVIDALVVTSWVVATSGIYW